MINESKTCQWPGNDLLMQRYHNEEWGEPLHNDDKLFEFVILDCFQAGLSWKTILHKRENFRKAFNGFKVEIISLYDENKINKLLDNPGIIRNRLKINATVTNAKAFLNIQSEFGTFDNYIWQFTNGKPITNSWSSLSEIPATSMESDKMSRDLQKRGFKFVGSTICYAFMQASGMINDHLIYCYRHNELKNKQSI